MKMKRLGNQQRSSEQENVQRLSRKGVIRQAFGRMKQWITYVNYIIIKTGGEQKLYDEHQKVIIKWNNTNRDWYESLGYKYTKRYDEFEVEAKDLSPGSAAKIHLICDYCGNEYTAQMDTVRAGRRLSPKDACQHCAVIKGSEIHRANRARRYFTAARQVCEQQGLELLSEESEYTNLRMRVQYLCPRHGVKDTILDNLIRGHGCLECSYETRFDSVRHDQSYIDAIISHINGNEWLNKGEYKSASLRNLQIRCKCGNTYTTSFSNFLRHNVTQCYSCSCKESVGETIVREFLDNNNIEYIPEKRFPECRDKKPLPFDFFLPGYNTCIEFDGKQHFEELDGFSDLDTIQRHDVMKNQYCADHGIRMIRIPYYDGHKIDQILTDALIT